MALPGPGPAITARRWLWGLLSAPCSPGRQELPPALRPLRGA